MFLINVMVLLTRISGPDGPFNPSPCGEHRAPSHLLGLWLLVQSCKGHQGPPFGHQGLPFGHQSFPFGHQGLPFGHQGLPFGHQGLPFGHQGLPFGHKGLLRSPPQNKSVTNGR